MGEARDRKLGRTAPSPSRLWAYHDPSDSGSDSVYHRATEDERVTQKLRRTSAVHKPARLRYNSKQEANETKIIKAPISSLGDRKAQKIKEKIIYEPTFTQASTSDSYIFHRFNPAKNSNPVDDSIENFVVLPTKPSEETIGSPKRTETSPIDRHVESPMSLGEREQMTSKSGLTQLSSNDDAVNSSVLPNFLLQQKNYVEKMTTDPKWSSNSPVISTFLLSTMKNVTEKSENRKFSEQNVEFQHAYPTFHPLRPSMSSSDARKRNEFYEKFAQQQHSLHQQSLDKGEVIETDSVIDLNTGELNENEVDVKEMPSHSHIEEKYASENGNYQYNNEADKKEVMTGMEPAQNSFDHSDFLQINETDDYDQLLYLKQLKNNQRHLIDNKNKVISSVYTDHGGKQMFSEANESNVLRKQNLDIPQSFINFDPMKLPFRTHAGHNAISTAKASTATSVSSSSEDAWLERKHHQAMEALQPNPLQQLVLQRQRIALQHLQRNVKPHDDAQQPMKPFFSASLYRRSDAVQPTDGIQGELDNSIHPRSSQPECGGEFMFELDPLNFAQHPRERAFSQSFKTPGYGSGEPYAPGLTCLWTVKVSVLASTYVAAFRSKGCYMDLRNKILC
ncbi:hypothetical protein FHG87_017572 [Trinorchestia longiramus]|nr:hypothetical protein FHG87_017572 [Trinorchestia longiramus]